MFQDFIQTIFFTKRPGARGDYTEKKTKIQTPRTAVRSVTPCENKSFLKQIFLAFLNCHFEERKL